MIIFDYNINQAAISNGTTGFVLGSDPLSAGHLTFTTAGITDNTAFDYYATCLSVVQSWSQANGVFTIPQWETGKGIYYANGYIARINVLYGSSGANTLVNFINPPNIIPQIIQEIEIGSNVVINAIGIFFGANNLAAPPSNTQSSITFGNSVSQFFVNSTILALGNSTVNAVMNAAGIFFGANNLASAPSSFNLGNSTSQFFANSLIMEVGNSTVNAIVNASSIAIGNSSVNATMNTTGIFFGANNLSAQQLNTSSLSDYTGPTSWTPSLHFGAGNTGMTYTSRTGSYIKIGQMVFAQFSIVLSHIGSSSGSAIVWGLPLVANHEGAFTWSSYTNLSLGATLYPLYGKVNAGTSNIALLVDDNPANSAGMTETYFSNTTSFSGMAVYDC